MVELSAWSCAGPPTSCPILAPRPAAYIHTPYIQVSVQADERSEPAARMGRQAGAIDTVLHVHGATCGMAAQRAAAAEMARSEQGHGRVQRGVWLEDNMGDDIGCWCGQDTEEEDSGEEGDDAGPTCK